MPDPDPQSPPPLPDLEVLFHGAVRKIPMAEVPKFVGIALQDEHRRGELTRMQAELRAQSDAQANTLKLGQTLADFARVNPAAGRALDQIYSALADGTMTPEQVLALRGGGQELPETNGAAVPTSQQRGDPQTRAALDSLAEELKGVKSAVLKRDEADRVSEQRAKIDAALATDTYLRSHPGAAKIVRGLLAPHLDAGLSIEQAVVLEAANFKAALTETQQVERDRLQAQSVLGSPPPSAGVPPVMAPDLSKMPPNLSPEERRRWMKTSIRDAGRNLISTMQRGAVSGPSS